MKKRNIFVLLILLVILSLCGCSSAAKNNLKNNVESKNLASKKISNKKETKKPEEKKPEIFKVGSKGKEVKYIQDRLISYGYPVSDDGNFGIQTDWAVRDFQYRHDITMDGSVSDNTMSLLKEKPTPDKSCNSNLGTASNSEVQTYKSAAEQTANSNDLDSYTKYLILASLKEQRIYIFNGSNHSWNLINTFQCTSGAAGTPTITGHFFVQGKGPSFKTGNNIICKYYTQIQGNYLFHSILYDENGNVVDGTLGASLSHGCMRLAVQNAKYIYDNMPMGTAIWIY